MSDWPVGVRFGGLGGQGLVTAGAVLAEAGARAGLQVAASQSYGSQARGGATRSDVILSAQEIDFPHVVAPNLLVVLAQEAYQLYADNLSENGVVLTDAFFVKPTSRPTVRQFAVEGTRLAIQEAGNKMAANFVMLGALVGYTQLVDPTQVTEAIRELISKRFLEVNLKAFDLGNQAGADLVEMEGAWR